MEFKKWPFSLPLCVLLAGAFDLARAVEDPALVDPTRPVAFVAPVGKAEPEEKKMQLQAIFSADGKRKAVINGQTVKVGESVNQAKIVAIDSGRVRFIKNGERGELVLLPTVLQPAKVEE